MKHHVNRFFSSSQIDREQPFYYYILTILWGLIPWVFSAIAVGISKFKEIKMSKFLLFNLIAFGVTLLFFSASSTKLITYILPVYFFTANILGFIWEDYIFSGKFSKPINFTVYMLGGICIFAGITAFFMQYFLPAQIYQDILSIKWFCIITVLIFGISSILCALKNLRKGVFACYALLIIITSAFGTKLFYNLDYKFGQDDLMQFAKYAKENNNKIVVLNSERRYSVLYYYGKHVYYISLDDEEEMKKFGDMLDDTDVVVVVKEKKMPEVDKELDFDVIIDGRKYSLIKVR